MADQDDIARDILHRFAADGAGEAQEGGLPSGDGLTPKAQSVRSLDWEGFYSAVAELGRRVFADSAYGGFWPDAVVGVNHGGAIVAGLLYYAHSRSFEIFTIAARENDFVSGAQHLGELAELADRHQRQIRVLLVDDSVKSGASLRLARTAVGAALSGRSAVVRTAVLVYRRDYHEKAGTHSAAPDEHIYTDIDHLPYGPV